MLGHRAAELHQHAHSAGQQPVHQGGPLAAVPFRPQVDLLRRHQRPVLPARRPALRAAGKDGAGAPFNIGAGDGDPSAFQRVNGKEFQAATVPEPLSEQGWQIVDEFNRAFSKAPDSGYTAPVHIATSANSGGALSWDSEGYRQAYRKIWGK